MLTNKLAYEICRIFLNEAEIKGATDNPLIELAHKTTKIEGVGANAPDTDAIPWCASWVNLMTIYACFFLNQSAARTYLNNNFKDATKLIKLLGEVFTYRIEPHLTDHAKNLFSSSEPVTLPIGAALAIKWQDWGQSVSNSDALEGDLIILYRTGGYHICFLAQPELDISKDTFKGLGGNQSDKVCIADLKTAHIIGIRRCNNYKKDNLT
jgi:hypothetical protein